MKALDAIVDAGDRAGTALTLIGLQCLRGKTPAEIVATFSAMATELQPRVDLVGEQF